MWWLLPYDDPNSGKHFEFEWEASIASRNTGVGCPFLTGRCWTGYNDLTITNPELIKYWDYEKNEEQDIKIKATDKGVKFVLVNFKNPLGTCVGHPLEIATRGETKIYFAFAVYQLGVAKILYFNVCEGK